MALKALLEGSGVGGGVGSAIGEGGGCAVDSGGDYVYGESEPECGGELRAGVVNRAAPQPPNFGGLLIPC
jgi:hypothetical protein